MCISVALVITMITVVKKCCPRRGRRRRLRADGHNMIPSMNNRLR